MMNGDITALMSAIGGRYGWRYWWPVVPWLVDVGMVATFRQDSIHEPAGVLFLSGLALVPVLWLWGARFAITLGHSRRRIYPVTVALSVLVPLLWQGVGSASRFATGQWGAGEPEGLFLLYGLPLVALLILGCALGLGYGWPGAVITVVVCAPIAALFYLVLWPVLGSAQVVVGSVVVMVMLAAAAWGGWRGFRVARA